MLTLIAIVAFVSIPYALDVHFGASRQSCADEDDNQACDK